MAAALLLCCSACSPAEDDGDVVSTPGVLQGPAVLGESKETEGDPQPADPAQDAPAAQKPILRTEVYVAEDIKLADITHEYNAAGQRTGITITYNQDIYLCEDEYFRYTYDEAGLLTRQELDLEDFKCEGFALHFYE